jgi:hypothetical protein
MVPSMARALTCVQRLPRAAVLSSGAALLRRPGLLTRGTVRFDPCSAGDSLVYTTPTGNRMAALQTLA